MFKKWTRLMLKILKPFTIFAKKASSMMLKLSSYFTAQYAAWISLRLLPLLICPAIELYQNLYNSLDFLFFCFVFFVCLFLYLASKIIGFIVYQYISINNISGATSCNFQLSSCFNFLFTKFSKNS